MATSLLNNMKFMTKLLQNIITLIVLIWLSGCSTGKPVNLSHSNLLVPVVETKFEDLKFIDISSNGQFYLAAGNYGPVRIWENTISDKSFYEMDTENFSQLVSAHFIDNSSSIFLAGRSGIINILPANEPGEPIIYNLKKVAGLADISSDKKFISTDGYVFNTETKTTLPKEAPVAVQSSVQFVGNSLLLVASIHNNLVTVRDLALNQLNTFEFNDKVFNAAIDESKRWLIVSLSNGELILSDVKTKKRLASFKSGDTATEILFIDDIAYIVLGNHLDVITLPEFKIVESIIFDSSIQVVDIEKEITALGTFTGELYILSKDKKSINNVIANYQFDEVIEAIRLNLQTGKLLVGGRDGKLGLYKIESFNP
jgi:WD40 repeat protein